MANRSDLLARITETARAQNDADARARLSALRFAVQIDAVYQDEAESILAEYAES